MAKTKSKKNFLIYGAYGYTGELIAELAVVKGYKPILAGRNPDKLRKLADRLKLSFISFDLKDSKTLDETLAKVRLVLHIAGPFSATAEVMVNACLRNKVHYLDVTGEIEVFEWVAAQDAKAKEAGIVLIPGVGFDVVPSDCLAAYLKSKMPDALSLELAIKAVGQLSRGTTLTMLENAPKGGMIREKGILKKVPSAYKSKKVRFAEDKEYDCVSIPWGDVATAYHSTQIPNIMVYMAADKKLQLMMSSAKYFGWFLGLSPVQALLKSQVKWTITGPNEEHRQKSRSYLWGEVKNAKGESFTALMETPEGYQLTAMTALESALRVVDGKVKAGFHTPSTAFGADYILEFEGVSREDV